MKAIIVAYDDGRVIGDLGQLPWAGKMPADMKRVRELTTNHAIIMGRATFESIGRALPDRQNIVLTSRPIASANIQSVTSLKEAFELVGTSRDAFIFGGGKVYSDSLNDADRLGIDTIYATEIHANFDGDAFFPDLNPKEWIQVERQDFPADEKNEYPYSFIKLKRR